MGNVFEKVFVPSKEKKIEEVWSEDACISKEQEHKPFPRSSGSTSQQISMVHDPSLEFPKNLDLGLDFNIFVDLMGVDELNKPNTGDNNLKDTFIEVGKRRDCLSMDEDDLLLSEDSTSGNGSLFGTESKRTRKFLPRQAKVHKEGTYAESKICPVSLKQSRVDDSEEEWYEATLDEDEAKASTWSHSNGRNGIYDHPHLSRGETLDSGRKEYSASVSKKKDFVMPEPIHNLAKSVSISSHSNKISVGSCEVTEENMHSSRYCMKRSSTVMSDIEDEEEKSMKKSRSSHANVCGNHRDTVTVEECSPGTVYMQEETETNQGQQKLKRSLLLAKQTVNITKKARYKEKMKHGLQHGQSCKRKLSSQSHNLETDEENQSGSLHNPTDLDCVKKRKCTQGKDGKKICDELKKTQRKLKRSRKRQRNLYQRKNPESSSRMDKKEFDDLFERILKSTDELRNYGSTSSHQIPKENETVKIPWDPIIFHTKQVRQQSPTKADDPLKSLWEDMEIASREMHANGRDESSCKIHCKHVLELDENEGYVCIHCGLVTLEIDKVLAPLENKIRYNNKKDGSENDLDVPSDDDDGFPTIEREPVKCDINSAWSQIEELKEKMRDHQRDGFEFLWKNIGASFSRDGNAIGGCVLAHPPGTGKSLLIISFLKSFMQLNTWSRALIVAPKNMILPWQDEFEKWSANINVHLMKSVKGKPSFEYLKIISEWHQTPSVLVVSYGLFSKLTDESIWSKKLEYRKIGKLLLYIPDLFVMDEGHVPRRDCSKLRKSICRVRTWGRILVSGTLFQNDVHELFNSLYLARPSFLYNLDVPYLNERLDGLDKENIKQWQRFEDFQILRTKAEEETEARSRKLFLEEIGSKLDITNEEEFRNGMKKYRSITRSFVHSYDGEILNILPGLKESVVLLQITRMQEDLLNEVKKLRLRSVISDYVDTLINIHPSLLLEVEIPRNSLSIDDEKLQQMRNDPRGGGKVQFILDMANRCQLTKEKLLIFSQYIAPLRLMKEHLEGKFKVFFITGKSLVLERQDIMESFNDGNGGTQILLASLTACGEGINLTGASRVIFLDMHWNPSRMKQASSRAFRIGQKNVVYTYWLIASGEKEANKYTRIEKKASLSRSITASKAEECGYKQQENTNAPNTVGEDVILDDLMKNSALKIIDVVRRSAMEEEDNLSALLRQ